MADKVQLNTAKSFLDRVMQHVPEAERAGVQSEFSKAQDEVRALETTLEQATAKVRETGVAQTNWWEANKGAVAERDALRKKVEEGGSTTVDENAIQKRIDTMKDEVIGTGLGLVTTLTNIGLSHMREFNEVIDTEKLAQEAIAAKKTLTQHYNETVAERRQKLITEKHQAEIAAARAEGEKTGVEKALKAQPGGGLPYPVGQSSTTLGSLKVPAADRASQFGLEAAVATANAEVAKQT